MDLGVVAPALFIVAWFVSVGHASQAGRWGYVAAIVLLGPLGMAAYWLSAARGAQVR